MPKRWRALAGAATVLLTACPYHGRVPLGPPQPELFDERLLGEWIADSTDASTAGRHRLWFARFDEDEYVVAGIGACPVPGGRGYLTKLADRSFLNVREESDEGLYRIGRLELSGSTLRLIQLSDSLDGAATSESLRARLLARMDDSLLYEPVVSYRRTGTPVTAEGAAALAVLPQSCTYDGDVLLEEQGSDSALDALVGSWRGVLLGDTVAFDVRRRSAGRAAIGIVEGERVEDALLAYATTIRDALFLSGREGENQSPVLARVNVAGDTAEIWLVNSGVRADSPAALRRLIAERLDDPLIYYWEPIRLVRRR